MIKNPELLVAIALGGALGALARYGVSVMSVRCLPGGFPWGSMIVNITGSLLLGIVIAWLSVKSPAQELLRGFIVIGLLGAFTTFSTFSLDAVTLFEKRGFALAAIYIGLSVTASIAGLLAGLMAGSWLGRSVS